MGGRWSVMAVAGCGLLALAGCATVPAEEVEIYARAFDEARAAGDRVYDEIGPIVARTEAEAAAAGDEQGSADDPAPATAADATGAAVCPPITEPMPYPVCFEPARFLPGGVPGEPDNLAARRRALDTIATYNAVALRLASGESAAALRGEVRRLTTGAAALAAVAGAGPAAAPLGALAGGVVGELAAWAETLRADRTLRAALAAGAPIIERLLDALTRDTPVLYALRRDEVADELDQLALEVASLSEELMMEAGGHERPVGALTMQLSQFEGRANNARDRMGGFEEFLALTAQAGTQGSAPFDDRTAERLDGLTTRIEALASRYDERVTTLNRYHAALGEYVAMLHEVGATLDAVAAAARGPQAVTLRPAELAARATEVRVQAREVRRLLEGA